MTARAEVLQRETRLHYDDYPFIEGGSNRIAWWRRYLKDFLQNERIADRLIVDAGSSIGEISRGLADRGARMGVSPRDHELTRPSTVLGRRSCP